MANLAILGAVVFGFALVLAPHEGIDRHGADAVRQRPVWSRDGPDSWRSAARGTAGRRRARWCSSSPSSRSCCCCSRTPRASTCARCAGTAAGAAPVHRAAADDRPRARRWRSRCSATSSPGSARSSRPSSRRPTRRSGRRSSPIRRCRCGPPGPERGERPQRRRLGAVPHAVHRARGGGGGIGGGWLRFTVEQIGYGALIGAAAGVAGGVALRRAAARGGPCRCSSSWGSPRSR